MREDPDTGAPDLTGHGQREARWRTWSRSGDRGPRGWPPARLPPHVERIVAVSPHPDDVVLAVGGLLQLAHAAGLPVTLLAATDGEASHPGSPTVTPAELARRRVAEDRAAFRALGVPLADEWRLGLPDGGLAAHEDRLVAAITGCSDPDTLLLAPWAHDGHPDHDATGRAALRCRATGGVLWSYPVWTWHWAEPVELERRWTAPRRVDLPVGIRARKRAAVAAHRSQVAPLGPDPADAPILPPPILARFDRVWETVLA